MRAKFSKFVDEFRSIIWSIMLNIFEVEIDDIWVLSIYIEIYVIDLGIVCIFEQEKSLLFDGGLIFGFKCFFVGWL